MSLSTFDWAYIVKKVLALFIVWGTYCDTYYIISSAF